MADRMVFFKMALLGGASNALDNIDGDDRGDGNPLQDLDLAFTIDTSVFYVHQLDDDSAAVESSPDVVKPDTNAGDKRWLLVAKVEDVSAYVAKALFNAHTILAATADDTPAAVTVAEQTVVGRLTGGNIDDITIGVADNNIVQIDSADVADNDYAKFTANGVEGRSYSETATDLKDQFPQAITDNHVLTVDSADAGDDEYCRFTANGIEGRTVAEMKTDIGIDYRTIYIPANAMIPNTTAGGAAGSTETGTNDHMLDYVAFDGGATEEGASFSFVMPEDWDRSTIKAKFFWSSATSSTTGDTVEWGIKAVAVSNDDALDVAYGTAVTVSDALLADNGTDLQVTAATAAITVGGTPALGDIVFFKIYRNTDGTDDMTEDAWLFGAWIQYKATNTVAAW